MPLCPGMREKNAIPPAAAHYVRLFKDARLLAEHGRVDSAYALGVVGLEEVAKTILAHWETMLPPPLKLNRGRNAHISKQTAIGCLLHAEALVPAFAPMIAERDTAAELKLEEIQRLWSAGADRALLRETFDEELQRGKHAALYYDGEIVDPKRTVADYNRLLDYAKRAILAIGDYSTMCVGLSMYHSLNDKSVKRDSLII